MSPLPGVARLAGTIQQLTGNWDIIVPRGSLLRRKPTARWHILDGLRCDGSPLGSGGPCDRWCPLLWHESWLERPERGPGFVA
jgi:hypothetical protein